MYLSLKQKKSARVKVRGKKTRLQKLKYTLKRPSKREIKHDTGPQHVKEIS